jgi:hypothetical protein
VEIDWKRRVTCHVSIPTICCTLLDNLLFSFGDNLTFGAAERMELV